MQKTGERQTRYNKLNTTSVLVRLNKKTDQDVIEHLAEVGNKQGYIKALIRKDMQAQNR